MSQSSDTPSEPGPPSAIEAIIDARSKPIDLVTVRRVLPAIQRRHVGPFLFLDHMGPAEFQAGQGIDVRPHPHIHLATITYLFEGAILHRDNLGSAQVIEPGDLNWMTAGRGIAHSERTPEQLRTSSARVHGLQIWLGLPQAHEDTEPQFLHYPRRVLPELELDGVSLRVLVGSAYGVSSPVHTFSPTLYVEATMPTGSSLLLPEMEERALYVVEGAISCEAERCTPGRMLVFAPGARVCVEAETHTRLVLIGGAPLDGERFMWWNFVSSSKDRIEQAKRDWKEGRFPKVPGDEVEFIPLPES